MDKNIDELLFVYQSAYKWFLHSLKKEEPIRVINLPGKYLPGSLEAININGNTIKCTLLPSPLNRGRKGETLASKLLTYRK